MHPSGSDNCGETKRSDFEGVVYLFRLVFLVPHLPFISNHHPEVLRHHLQPIPAVRNSSRPSSVTPRSIHTRGHSFILGATHLYSVPLIYTRCHSSILGATHLYSVPLTLRHPKESISPYSHLQHTPVTSSAHKSISTLQRKRVDTTQ